MPIRLTILWSFCLVLLTGGMTAPVRAKEVMLEPASKWVVNYADKACMLLRKFGTDESPFLLRMHSYGSRNHFEFSLAGKDLNGIRSGTNAGIAFGPGETLAIDRLQAGNLEGYGKSFLFSGAFERRKTEFEEEGLTVSPDPDPEFEKAVDRIALVSGPRRIVLHTGKMDAPLKAMRQCVDAMMESWGLDPKVQATLSRPTKPESVEKMVRRISAHYPLGMAMTGRQGRVNVRAMIDAQGMPTKCEVTQSYSERAFDELACQIIRETAFEPALDAKGQPTPSFYQQTILYLMH
ncbi:energy transducer TonB [Novosphingobium sp. KN65.2]|uniref:energy transducer TonB n=1 Tax=Novosphingobium sp. KN65.2 TaxID=1478134 RepID=UPI0005DC9686|nr:energy transducer TonB [Novosphingobium sp. KN65.2]CDO35115.1 exported hypothetical protein [Novosphingobium sp. KN65.2]